MRITLSEYIVSSVLSILATARDGPTGIGERYCCVPESVKSGVLVPLSSRPVRAIQEFRFFHIFRSADFDTALVYVAFCCPCRIGWRLVPSSCYQLFYRYHWNRMTINDPPAIEGRVKRRADWTEYRVSCQDGVRARWHSFNYETLDGANLLPRRYF